MTTPKFTPGPWTVERGERCLFIYDSREDVTSIAHLGRTGMDHDDEANATLIASAPALYAALERLLTDAELINRKYCAGHYDPESFQQARAALAMARGEKGE